MQLPKKKLDGSLWLSEGNNVIARSAGPQYRTLSTDVRGGKNRKRAGFATHGSRPDAIVSLSVLISKNLEQESGKKSVRECQQSIASDIYLH